MAAVQLPVHTGLLVNRSLPLFQPGGLAGAQFTGGDPVGNPILLVLAAGIDFVVAVVLRCRVVFVAVNLPAHRVLLAGDDILFLLSQMPAVERPIRAHFLVNRRFFPLQVCGLSSCQRSRLDPLSDAVLLVLAPLIDSLRAHPEREGGSQNRPHPKSVEPLHCCFLLLTV